VYRVPTSFGRRDVPAMLACKKPTRASLDFARNPFRSPFCKQFRPSKVFVTVLLEVREEKSCKE
jgi:hypothetical protein